MIRPIYIMFLVAAIGAGGGSLGAACACQVIETFPGDETAAGDAHHDETAPLEPESEIAGTEPHSNAATFLQYVEKTYLSPKDKKLLHLRPREMAMLIGYAIGETTIRPAPVDVFADGFNAELERWIGRLGVYGGPLRMPGGPAEADAMWRLIEEGARGFYDAEMRAAYGSVADDKALTSIEKWFQELNDVEKQQFLIQAAAAGVARNNSEPYTIKEFESVSVLMDAEFDRQGFSASDRHDLIHNLAAGKTSDFSKE